MLHAMPYERGIWYLGSEILPVVEPQRKCFLFSVFLNGHPWDGMGSFGNSF
jgi:hypothetical protein